MENSETEDLKIEQSVELEKDVEVKPIPIKVKEKRNSKDEKSRKKDERSVEHILKNMNDLDGDKKMNVMVKKYTELLEDYRKLQIALKLSQKKVLVYQRENHQCESERSKTVLARNRLESLCRELQRQNKAIKEESLLKIKEEEDKRKEVSAKFQSTLAEITLLMTETNEKNKKLHDDNLEVQKKFKTVFEEMDLREQHFEKMHEMMKEELKATEAKLAKVTLEMTEEKEKMLIEKGQLLQKLGEYTNRIRELQAVEAGLRTEVNMYTEKYADFQNALTKSNQVFSQFNEQMEKMSKKILKLEKETNMWKTRWEKSNNALLEMATSSQAKDAEFAALNKKCAVLQELCKTFQQERVTLLAELKEKSQKPDLESNKQPKVENHQQQNESIDTGENTIVNGLIESDNIKTEIEEQTKESKTDLICSTSNITESESCEEKQESNMNDSKVELSEKKVEHSAEIVNNKNEDTEKIQELQSVNEKGETISEENVSECNEKKEILTDNIVKDVNPTETTTSSCEQVSESSQTSNTNSKNSFEAENVENTNVSNGDVNTNFASNKKHKEGKKKRK